MESVLVAIIGFVQAVLLLVLDKRSMSRQNKQHNETQRNVSRNSIENMIMWDEFNYEFNGRLPTNYEEVHDAYDAYHAAGGNGVMTKRVEDYDSWLDKVEKKQGEK